MTAFHELEDWRLDWNSASKHAESLSDDELLDFITKYEKLILEYKVKKEAAETVAEKRNIRKPKFKLDRTTPTDNDAVAVAQMRSDDKQAKSLDKAFMALKKLGLSDVQARAQLASMSRASAGKEKK